MGKRGKGARGIPLSSLGKPALLQLQAQGLDVSRQLAGAARSPAIPQQGGKYHVAAAEDRTVDGIVFASKNEMTIYLCLKHHGVKFDRQPSYELQEAFDLNGKHHRAITYVGDFLIRAPDGCTCLVDVKGMETDIFKLKRKLLMHRYRIEIECIKNVNGMITFLHSKGLLHGSG